MLGWLLLFDGRGMIVFIAWLWLPPMVFIPFDGWTSKLLIAKILSKPNFLLGFHSSPLRKLFGWQLTLKRVPIIFMAGHPKGVAKVLEL
jgi:hypothetical protein